jgi:hypothetical protein
MEHFQQHTPRTSMLITVNNFHTSAKVNHVVLPWHNVLHILRIAKQIPRANLRLAVNEVITLSVCYWLALNNILQAYTKLHMRLIMPEEFIFHYYFGCTLHTHTLHLSCVECTVTVHDKMVNKHARWRYCACQWPLGHKDKWVKQMTFLEWVRNSKLTLTSSERSLSL